MSYKKLIKQQITEELKRLDILRDSYKNELIELMKLDYLSPINSVFASVLQDQISSIDFAMFRLHDKL
jgi:hypothetical protein